nr:MAG TPA: hypothetical protein [Caudoviricetes sp.]
MHKRLNTNCFLAAGSGCFIKFTLLPVKSGETCNMEL